MFANLSCARGCPLLWQEAVLCSGGEDEWDQDGIANLASIRLAISGKYASICMSKFQWTCGDEEGIDFGFV